MRDEYRSIAATTRKTLRVEGSKFIATAVPVESLPRAEEAIGMVRKKFFDATHNCYAYAIGSERELFRHSDDREPTGTAGMKILSAVESVDVSDVLVVVTRYFGGTKLGIGGLGRAYFESARDALRSASYVLKQVTEELEILFPYDEINAVMTTISRAGAKIVETAYQDDVSLRVSVRKRNAPDFVANLTRLTRGNLAVKYLSSSAKAP